MRLLRYLIIISIALLTSCSDDEPSCISELIDNFKNNQQDCTGANIAKYQFMGTNVYTFSDGQCISDGGTQIWDSECNSVCFLGGIAGFDMCMDRDFYEEAIFMEEIFRVE